MPKKSTKTSRSSLGSESESSNIVSPITSAQLSDGSSSSFASSSRSPAPTPVSGSIYSANGASSPSDISSPRESFVSQQPTPISAKASNPRTPPSATASSSSKASSILRNRHEVSTKGRKTGRGKLGELSLGKGGGSGTDGSSVSARSDSAGLSTGRSGSTASTPFAYSSDNEAEHTHAQRAIRLGSLYVFPALLAIPVGLLLHLTTTILTPLYNSLPLSLHPYLVYIFHAIPPAALYAFFSLKIPGRDIIGARASLVILAVSSDLIVVMGRRVGSIAGGVFGAEWGAFAAKVLLGTGVVAGALGFALLCFDHVLPLQPASHQTPKAYNGFNVIVRVIVYMAHIYLSEQVWIRLLEYSDSFLVQRPEKTILFISLLLTILSLFVRTPQSTNSFANSTHSFLSTSLNLTPKRSSQLREVTGFLPRTTSPILLLLRLPLLILAVRQQVFLRPTPPYIAGNGQIRILRSEKSITGQIVVGEHLGTGYRFLRCDASLLGGRWQRDANNVTRVDLGDSIFSTFTLQEVGVLAIRSDEEESLARTISMTTELQLTDETDFENEEKPQERALVIGLGVGISAGGLAKRGLAVDAVEIDPAVYHAAVDYFNLSLPSPPSTVSLVPAQQYISQVSALNAASNNSLQKWSYVVHDCFSAGRLPTEVFSVEFWRDLSDMVEVDGIVTVNVAGAIRSLATRRILITLISVFEQCRIFGELGNEVNSDALSNIVILCTMAHSPLLSFRRPTRFDVLRSPLRSYVFSNFHSHEISIEDLLSDGDWAAPDMLIVRDGSTEGLTQVDAGLATWRSMQQLMTKEMWLAW